MNFKNINEGHTVTDEFGVTYSEDGGILLYADPEIFSCGEYHVPSSVRVIWDHAFYGARSLEKVIFDDCHGSTSLLYVGEFAFSHCKKLREIDLPDSIIRIEQCLFAHCPALKRVHLPLGITSIPCECFSMCEGLEDVNIPDGVRNIGICGFRGCSSLEEITLPDTLEWLEDTSFAGCAIRGIRLPEGLRFIGEDCFRKCPLDELVVPESVREIIPWTVSWHPGFKGVKSLSKHFRIENDALIANADDAILCCWSNNPVYYIPQGVRNIRGFANACVEKVIASHPIESISYDCFGGCDNLKELCLYSVDDIDETAFYGISLTSLTIGGVPQEILRGDDNQVRAMPYRPYSKR